MKALDHSAVTVDRNFFSRLLHQVKHFIVFIGSRFRMGILCEWEPFISVWLYVRCYYLIISEMLLLPNLIEKLGRSLCSRLCISWSVDIKPITRDINFPTFNFLGLDIYSTKKEKNPFNQSINLFVYEMKFTKHLHWALILSAFIWYSLPNSKFLNGQME